MIIRLFTRFYPNIPFKCNPRSIIKPQGESWSFQGVEASYIKHQRAFAEKGDKPSEPGKEEPAKDEEVTVKMPGFIHPETINEEGYFTQKAKQQLEELKRKTDKPALTNPEKKN